MDKTYLGKVKKFFIDKGFGFIYCKEFKEDIFFHVDQCIFDGMVLPKYGDLVEFQLYEDNKGKKAINIYKKTPS